MAAAKAAQPAVLLRGALPSGMVNTQGGNQAHARHDQKKCLERVHVTHEVFAGIHCKPALITDNLLRQGVVAMETGRVDNIPHGTGSMFDGVYHGPLLVSEENVNMMVNILEKRFQQIHISHDEASKVDSSSGISNPAALLQGP